MRPFRPLLPLAALLAPSLAFAHSQGSHAIGFGAGLWHPFSGLDHLLAMVAIGIWAAWLGGSARWRLPATFVAAMAVAAAWGVGTAGLAANEAMIACSVVALGILVAGAWNALPARVATAVVVPFAIAHGHAHGAEMPLDANGLAYGAGFVLAALLLHAAGLGLGAWMARRPAMLARAVGIAIALVGATILVTR
ncbi:MAG: HupE/UreJ family protein [Burkholderiaceae bacterium]